MDGNSEQSPTALWRELKDALTSLLRSTLSLAMAEGRLAVLSSVSMVVIAVLAGGVLFGAWLFMNLALAYGAQALGAPLWAACAVLSIVHAVAAFLLWRGALRLGKNLEFPHTRRIIAESWARPPEHLDTSALPPHTKAPAVAPEGMIT
jgi:hypothetical protein